ncbi:unnamed protein product [Owenia fusiformis]|uniref:Uncharacterized protein n=1 Tax=Owenia fusiformis TaxID=6347 RepID=A0A8J1U2D3_OWEFU|nr:unnamed protein product [Owenia fusiformis]
MELNIKSEVQLNDGKKMPLFGLGTWQSKPDEITKAVSAALDAGYRHIDTAAIYGNEHVIGDILQERIKAGKMKREDVYITTKLWITQMAKDAVVPALKKSLEKLQLDYVDLYLIHGPAGLVSREDGTPMPLTKDGMLDIKSYDLTETWKGMEDCVKAGLAKSIGLSNFNSKQVTTILDKANIKPVTNQVECHCYFQQNKLEEFCKPYGIVLTAYAPIGSPSRPSKTDDEPVLLEDPVVKDIAKKYNKTTAQVLLRFLLQRGIVVIPKSVTPSRIKSNSELYDFELVAEDMIKLRSIDRKKRMLKSFDKGVEKHPDYPFHEEF